MTVKMKKIISLMLALSMLPVYIAAAENKAQWYVSPLGNDEGAGTKEDPFKTVAHASEVMSPGDVCYLRGGLYYGNNKILNSGTADNPISFMPFADEKVTFFATDRLSGWKSEGENLWSADMDWNMEDYGQENQLFCNGEAMVLGRWPNLPEGADYFHPEQSVITEGNRTYIKDTNLIRQDGFWTGGKVRIQAGYNWYNTTADIAEHTVENGLILENYSFGDYDYYNPVPGDKYYIFDSLNALDTEGEWYYDREKKKMYFYTSGNPEGMEISARKYDYTLDAAGQSHINISGIVFEGAALKLNNTEFINLDGITVGNISNAFLIDGNNITLKNSHIHSAPDMLLQLLGKNNVVFNCLIEKSNWVGSGRPMFNSNFAMNAYIAYNTVRYSGRTCFAPGAVNSVIEHNNFYDAGYLTEDTGVIYSGVISGGGTHIRYNLIHDVKSERAGMGLYLDNNNQNFVLHHNVVWDSENIANPEEKTFSALCLNLPSENILVYNNTFAGDAIPVSTALKYIDDCYVVNNIFTGANNMMRDIPKINNMWGWLDPGFADYKAEKFELLQDSVCIDSARIIKGINDCYEGKGPDLGAYEYGREKWSAGHNWEQIPPFNPSLPGYVAYANVVDNAGFEGENVERIFSDFGWKKIGDGQIDIEFAHSLSDYNLNRRSGDYGLRLGLTSKKTYPGDEIVSAIDKHVSNYNYLKKGYVNFPKYKEEDMYAEIPVSMNKLIDENSDFFSTGDFESGTVPFSMESSKGYVEENPSGGKLLRVAEMQYSWSGPRIRIEGIGNKKLRLSFKYKGSAGDTLNFVYTPDGIAELASRFSHKVLGNEWENVVHEIDSTGDFSKAELRVYTTSWNGGAYLMDDFSILDLTVVYKLLDACRNYTDVYNILDSELKSKDSTSESLGLAVEKAAKLLLDKDRKKGFDILCPLLSELRAGCSSMGGGVSYKVEGLVPGREYYYMCRGKVVDETDSIVFKAESADSVLGTFETSSKEWTDYGIKFTAPENGEIQISAYKPNGRAAAYVDDLYVFERITEAFPKRDDSKILNNGDGESGDVFPWYSFDGNISIENGCIKSTGAALQDMTGLVNGKKYRFTGDFRLESAGSVEVVLKILTTDGYLRNIPLAVSDAGEWWTTVSGEQLLDIPMIKTAGISISSSDGQTVFMDNMKIEEIMLPSAPGTGDENPDMALALKDKKEWFFSEGDQAGTVENGVAKFMKGTMCYTGKTYRDFTMTFNMRIDGYNPGNWPIIAVRSTKPATYASGYVFVIKDSVIELQKYGASGSTMLFLGSQDNPSGTFGPAVVNDMFVMGEDNEVEISTRNEENGVRVMLKVNGKTVYDFLDGVAPLDNAGNILFYNGGVQSITVTKEN